MLLYGAGMSDSNAHASDEPADPAARRRIGQLKGGRHIKYAEETPLANLHLTLLDKLGVPIDKLGNSTGKIEVPGMSL